MKASFGTLIKRTLWIIIAVIIVIVVATYFLGKYKASTNTVENEYPSDYWKQEKLDGFKYYDDITVNVKKFDYLDKENYKLPWVLTGHNEDGDGLTEKEKLEAARYQEELLSIAAKLRIDAIYREHKTKYDLCEKTYDGTVEEWLKAYFDITVDDLTDVTCEYDDVYEFALANGFEGEKYDFYSALRDAPENLIDLFPDWNDDEMALFKSFGVVALKNNSFALMLKDKKCGMSEEEYDEFITEFNKYDELSSLKTLLQKSLPKWDDYKNETLLGFGGLATDYPNKPVLSKTDSKGNTYSLWFNYHLTTFKLELTDKEGNVVQTWLSNPTGDDLSTNVSRELEQNTILNLNYSIFAGNPGSRSNYQYSVLDRNISTQEEITPNFAVRVDEETGKLIVWYSIEKRGTTYADFPKYISAERFDAMLNNNPYMGAIFSSGTDNDALKKALDDAEANGYPISKDDVILFLKIFGNLITKDSALNEFKDKFDGGIDYYEIADYCDSNGFSKMSIQTIQLLKKVMYDYCGYTVEDLKEDNDMFGQTIDISDPKYSIAIEYTITENGLDVMIPGNSIVDDPSYPLTYIDILPYFTATKAGIEGYTVIPDGSGSILNHDNNKLQYSKYVKRVYTTDLTYTSEINKGSFYDLMFPMYAVVNTGNTSGVIAYATQGASQLQLTADISGRKDNFNTNYFSAYYREYTTITLGRASYERKTVNKWTDAIVKSDLKLSFALLSEDELSYSAVAKRYQKILIDTYNIENIDTTTTPVLDMEVLGTYSFENNFVGIKYKDRASLTTLDEFDIIVQAFKNVGVKNINAFYYGWRKENLVNTSFKTIKMSGLLGSKEKFRELTANKDESLTVYPYVSFGEIVKFQESFGNNHYTTHDASGKYAVKQNYEPNTNMYDKKSKKIRSLSPRYYFEFAKKLADNYKKLTPSGNSLAIDKMGSSLAGDYKKGVETFKNDAIKEQIKSLEYMKEKGINKFTLYAPYDYAFQYTTIAKNIPFEGTKYEIIDYSIPFYQLVANGLFDYSGYNFNANSEKGSMEYLMHVIETGSNLAYTFTYESSDKLLQTDYKSYFYTLYSNWVTDVEYMYETLDELNIYKGTLYAHERLDESIYKVTYKVNNKDVVVYLNYSRNNYTAADGTVVSAKSFQPSVLN